MGIIEKTEHTCIAIIEDQDNRHKKRSPSGGRFFMPMGRRKRAWQRKSKRICAFDKIVPIAEVIGNPKNPTRHPDAQNALLTQIIKVQGRRRAGRPINGIVLYRKVAIWRRKGGDLAAGQRRKNGL